MHFERTEAGRVGDTDWDVAAAEAEEQPAGDVGVQCSRVEVVGGGAEVGDLASDGGWGIPASLIVSDGSSG